jgi:predicted dienelactone hydrolase
MLLTALSGCGLSSPTRGTVVEAGVAEALFEVRANSTDLVKVHVFFPADESGAPQATALPGLVFIQGGLVGTERYAWQATALAKRGYVVALPEHPLQLAFFAIDQGRAALSLLQTPPPNSLLVGLVDTSRVAVAGHSLGGVVAMKLALEGGFAAVVLEASFPDTADASLLPSFTHPSLSLAGTLDCSAKLDNVKAGWNTLPSPTALMVLPGVTHYQFTNVDTEDQAKCTPATPLVEAHAAIESALATFLGQALTHAALDEAGLRAGVPSAMVEVRP